MKDFLRAFAFLFSGMVAGGVLVIITNAPNIVSPTYEQPLVEHSEISGAVTTQFAAEGSARLIKEGHLVVAQCPTGFHMKNVGMADTVAAENGHEINLNDRYACYANASPKNN